MLGFDRITFDPNILGGKACIRGMRISVSLIVNLVANGMTNAAIAEALGITRETLARQVRSAFFGAEAQRIQRERDDVRVMIRYPLEERRSLASLEIMRIRTPDGRAARPAYGTLIDLSR